MAGKLVVEAENGGAAPSHLFVLWERAYESRLYRGQEEIIERGKTPEAAQVFLTKQTWHRPASTAPPRCRRKAPPSSASTSLRLYARETASTRFPTLSLMKICLTCVLTVSVVMERIRAISLLDRPYRGCQSGEQ